MTNGRAARRRADRGNSMITCGFIGLGLIGGSIARALKKNREDIRILACDPNPQTRSLALSQLVADEALEAPGEALFDCDFVFLCAPVSCNGENLEKILPYLKESCILTDVGSVKTPIYRQVQSMGLTDRFIGGHPMTGSERVGFVNSKASLLENAYYIMTPAPDVPEQKVEQFRQLVLSTGAILLQIDCERHDYVTAAVSHLPHIIASSLVNLVKGHDDNGLMKAIAAGGFKDITRIASSGEEEAIRVMSIAAGGFKDITRIASSSPVMWQQICLTNTDNIRSLLQDYIDALETVKGELDRRDADSLYGFFDGARLYRESFVDASSGPIKKAYTIRVTIPDETGSLAEVATLLASNSISIKNIGISHNREAEEGVLIIEFYEQAAIDKAVTLLTEKNFEVALR